jgi:hypothetical protein
MVVTSFLVSSTISGLSYSHPTHHPIPSTLFPLSLQCFHCVLSSVSVARRVMDEEVSSLIDQLNDRGRQQASQQQHSLLPPRFQKSHPPVIPRDRYRTTHHEPRHDGVDDDQQDGQDVTFNLFGEC